MIEILRRIVRQYDEQNPMRTADQHDEDCPCLRCIVDKARAHVAEYDESAQ